MLYKKIEETDEYSIYKFITISSYLYLLAIIILLLGIALDNKYVGGIGLLIYSILILLSYFGTTGEIRKARKLGPIEISGSKYSFNNPLIVKIQRNLPSTEQTK